ncbi:MAG: hypothetical protein WB792_16740 [Desulfobacterales bacterium]
MNTNKHKISERKEGEKVKKLACLRATDPWSPLAPPKAGKLLIF